MKSHRNGNAKALVHSLNHSGNSLKACHILSCTLGYTKDYGRLGLFTSQENGLGPLQVIDIKLRNGVMGSQRFIQHFLCIN